MTHKKKTWNELPHEQIARALEGDRKDLDALVRCYGPVVWGTVAGRVRQIPALAIQMEDLVGSVWLELCRNDFRRLRYYDRTRGEFGYFIRLQAGQIAWSLVVRQLDRAAFVHRAQDEFEPEDEGFEARVLSRDFLQRIAELAKARLGESDWALFNAAYITGLSSEEIATQLDKKVKTVYQQRYRMQAKLEAIASELLEEASPARDPNDSRTLRVVASLMLALSYAEIASVVDVQENNANMSTSSRPAPSISTRWHAQHSSRSSSLPTRPRPPPPRFGSTSRGVSSAPRRPPRWSTGRRAPS